MEVSHEDAEALLKPRVPRIKTKMAIKTKMGFFVLEPWVSVGFFLDI